MKIIKQFSNNLKEKRPGVLVNSITGKNAQMLYIKLNPGTSTLHNHSQEQMGFILSGSAEITINGKSVICEPGDAYYIPSNANHGFKVLNNTNLEYIEIFSPAKEENIL